MEKPLVNKKMIQIPAALCALALLAMPLAHAEALPLWELGVGGAALNMPDYRGSDVNSTYVLPLPYFIYRGEHLRVDRSGVHSMLLDSDRVQIDLSLNGSTGGRSKNNPARQGMADLRPMVEAGPTVNFKLWQSSDQRSHVQLRLPVRAGVTVESSPRLVGWLFSPNLHYSLHDPAMLPGWHLSAQAGPVFNDRRYDAHFYSVTTADATAARPAYAAAGGYAGSQATLQASRRFRHYQVAAFVRADALAGAAFRDSPLVKRRGAVSAGLFAAWIFSESSVKADEDRE